MKSSDLETDPHTISALKRKSDSRDNEEILKKNRRIESTKEPACSPDSTERTTFHEDRRSKLYKERSRSRTKSPQIAVTSTQHGSDGLPSPLLSPRAVDDRADADSATRLNLGRLSTLGAPGRFEGMSPPESFVQRDRESDGSLVRLFKQRFPWAHRELPVRRSAFREVCKDKGSTAFSPQHLPLRPRLLNDQLYGRTGFRPKIGKPFAGLSEINVGTDGEGRAGVNGLDASNKSSILNPTQPIIQPLQESRTRHLTLAQLAASGTSQTSPEALRLGPYSSLRQSLIEGRVDNNLNSIKRTQDHARYVENAFLPFGRYLGNGTNISTNQQISAPNNIPPYMALPGLMLAAAAPPIWQPPPLGMLTMPSENWCARCKTSFRMTSDLVYHMRTYHRRDTATTSGTNAVDDVAASSGDDVARKGDEHGGEKSGDGKTLRCNVCRETFRERHHLTRHMTSHVR